MMSNLPITYGKGSITYLANEIADDDLINQFIKLCSGPLFIEISKENEHLIDVSTILTGSMPAYLSFLSQIFIDFGNENGFSPEESRDLFVATLEGTKKMLESKIKIARKKRGWTQQYFANIVGCTREHLNKIENNNHNLSLRLAKELSCALGLKIEEL